MLSDTTEDKKNFTISITYNRRSLVGLLGYCGNWSTLLNSKRR